MAAALLFTTRGKAAQLEHALFDIDLTQGSAGPGSVTGSVWNRGWQCTGAKGERIVFDAGRPIQNGYLEVSFTVSELPWQSQQGKINYVGLHEHESLNQNEHAGDLFYARTGNVIYRFSNVKAAGRKFDRTEHEPRIGSTQDWTPDGRTVYAVRLEWRDGVPVFTDVKGRRRVFPRDIIGADTPIDRLRYGFIGSDRFTGMTVKGMRFLRVRLMDLGPEADGPERPRWA